MKVWQPRATGFAATLALASLCPCAQADDTTVTAAAGANYTSGNYGTATTTRIASFPFSLDVDTGSWDAKLTVPYLIVSGGTSVVPGVGATTNTNPKGRGRHGASSLAQGLGDVSAEATYDVYFDAQSRQGIDLTGKVKFGTANRDQGLGTGQNDYTGEISAFQGAGKLSLLADIDYTALGSSPYIKLRSGVVSGSIGGSYKLADDCSLGATLNATGALSATAGPARNVTAFVSWKFFGPFRIQTYALKGSGTGGPDFGAGANLSAMF